MDGFQQNQWPGWSYSNANIRYNTYQPYGDYTGYVQDAVDTYQGHHQHHLVHHHQMSRTTESKPRLSKEEVEVLEAEFQKNHKPNSSTKKALAESMRVDNARINNWFQNRRAREKKENNIRQYEARQKMEKEQNEANPQNKLDIVESRGLVASSAPFPSARDVTRESSHSTASGVDSETSASDDGRSDESDQESGLSQSASSLAQVKIESNETTTELLYTPSSEDLSLLGSECSDKANDVAPAYFAAHNQGVLPLDGCGEPTPSASSLSFPQHAMFSTSTESHCGSEQDLDYFSQSSPGVGSACSPSTEIEADLKSPNSLDIASRRNRRPPPLAIGGARSYTGGAPRTAIDLSCRNEIGREMRRVASANGNRISKSAAAPRSPFHDRRMEGLFHLNRSPIMTGPTTNAAPPTPDTPILAGNPALNDATSSSHLMVGPKLQTTGILAHDPTLRTPPTTPGLGDTFFSLNSAYDMSVSDQPLGTPGLGQFPGDFSVPALSMVTPNYIAGSVASGSQPHTPAFSAPMGPAYFGFGGGNAEYNWSAAPTASGRISPGQGTSGAHFVNMATPNFG